MISLIGKAAVLSKPVEKILIAGDIHGDFEAFRKTVEIHERNSNSILVFLGDYADRGEKGLEVIEALIELIGPRVIALKGNHEDYVDGSPNFYPWDLGWEIEEKRGIRWEDFFKKFEKDFLNKLPIAFLIPGFALCVHGGVCKKIRNFKDLEKPDQEIEECVLWNDPTEHPGEHPNPRGVGKLFGPDISEQVLHSLNVKYLIRSHEPYKALNGPFIEHDTRVITLSTTRVYGGRPFLLEIRTDKEFDPKHVDKNVIYL